MFPKVNPKQSFPEMEEKIIAFWKENETFKKSVEQRSESNPYRFYDGPPFITGTPHYGSLLSSIVKDIVPRYHTMQGKRVERKWGWDCHGLPIEEKVQKKLGLKSNKEIEELGIEKFIQECYTYTKEVSSEWDWYIDHIGRWVDMDNAYRTMDQDYMESVLWVFKQMHEKGRVYKGRRVSLYSWKLSTPISNFEVAMDDSYEEVSDPAVTVMFPIVWPHLNSSPQGEDETAASLSSEEREFKSEVWTHKVQPWDYIIAWTTTPWTIPAHMSMALNKNLSYSRVSSEDKIYVLATARVETVFKGREYEILESFLGEDLIGLKYTPPFDFYVGKVDADKNHKILHADFITDSDGTGVGHQAPEFGEVDFQLAQKEWVHISTALDNAGCYTEEIPEYEGMHYQDANDVVSEKLKELGLLFKKESINHRVAMCPRSGTKLIYKAQDSWFINIQEMKDRLLQENEGINWQPNHLKHGQFLKSVESAPDWCISRTRYWGTPMPIWKDSQDNMRVVGSKKEIFEANKPFGQLEEKDWKYYFTSWSFKWRELDLHRPFIDDVFAVNDKSFVAKKVLGVHWHTSNIKWEKWVKRIEKFKEQWMDLELFQFNIEEDPTYESWKETFDTIDFSQYDVVYTSSLWGLMTTKYIIENSIKLKRLVMAVPWLSISTQGGTRPNVQAIHENLWDINLENLVNEVVVIHAKDDDDVLFEQGEIFAEKVWAVFIEREIGGHPLHGSIPLLIWTIKHGEPMQRLPEVLDVWMDSASMPYAQMHYPFENKASMESSFPADFIVEYIGQVRAWFYVMHVVGVALFNTRAFTNVITTGIVMGSDGRKMSKSYGNYPDPRGTIGKYGADAIRFYMANSPLLNGGNMDFKEEGIVEVIKKVILPLWNTYSFFTTYANIDKFEKPHLNSSPQGEDETAARPLSSEERVRVRSNPLDTWIMSETHTLIAEIEAAMESYEITDATRPIVKFMDKLTNWYIRRSRKRFWKSENDGDKLEAYETLHEVLVLVSQIVAPFMPFITEEIYKNLTGNESVHLSDFPIPDKNLIDTKLNEDMDLCQKLINLGLSLRTAQKMRVRQPLQSISIGEHLSDYYKDIIKEELNVKQVIEVDSNSIAQKICKPNGRLIGPKFGKNVKDIMTQAKSGNFIELDENTVKVWEFILEWDDFEMAYVTDGENDNIESGFGMVIAMDLELTDALVVEWQARDIVRHIQEARKEAWYEVDDRITVNIVTNNLEAILASYDIASETLSTLDSSLASWDIEKEIELWEMTAKIILKK